MVSWPMGNIMYNYVIDNSTAMFFIAASLAVAFSFRTSSLRVAQDINAEREDALRNANAVLQRKVQRLEKAAKRV